MAAAASVGSALCPGPGWWIALRATAGAGFATVIPSVSLYYGGLRPAQARQRAFATLTSVTAASGIASPVLADTVLRCGSWRPAFAVIALLTAVTVCRIRAATRSAPPSRVDIGGAYEDPPDAVPGRPTAAYCTVLGLGAAEGAVMLGLPALLAPALATAGSQASTSAVLVIYALGVLTSTLVLRRHARVWGPPMRLLATGGSMGVTGALLAARWCRARPS